MRMTKEYTEKDKVVERLKGNEVKDYIVEMTNTITVVVEATNENEAEKKAEEMIERGNPYDEATDEYGWEIERVEEDN